MLDLSVITAALQAEAPALAQVVLPELVGAQALDSAEALLPLVEPRVGNRVYPLVLPESPEYPAAIYQLTGSERVEIDGYPILRDDDYLLATLARTYGTAADTAAAVRTAVLGYSPAAAAGAGDLLDQSDGYDVDFDLYEMALAVRLTHLARADQSLPAAFVYPLGEPWESGESITCVSGQAVSRFAVLLVAKLPAGGVSALGAERDEILNALVGLRPAGWGAIEPAGGDLVAVHGGLVLWRDQFETRQSREFSLLEA